MSKRKGLLFCLISLVPAMASCTWHNAVRQYAIYNCTFECWTAGNILNPDYTNPTGKGIEGYVDYLPYFASRYTYPNSNYWSFDYELNATSLITLVDGTTYQANGSYYSPTANSGTILVTLSTGEGVTLTWNTAYTGTPAHDYFELYVNQTINIPALGGDTTVWMLYHSNKIW
jgi:hypothetical protein